MVTVGMTEIRVGKTRHLCLDDSGVQTGKQSVGKLRLQCAFLRAFRETYQAWHDIVSEKGIVVPPVSIGDH